MISEVGVRFDQITVLTLRIRKDKSEEPVQHTATDQGLHCLPLIQHFLHIHR